MQLNSCQPNFTSAHTIATYVTQDFETPLQLFVGMLSSMNLWNLKTLKILVELITDLYVHYISICTH